MPAPREPRDHVAAHAAEAIEAYVHLIGLRPEFCSALTARIDVSIVR
jgi:hypothetical protein